MKCVVNKLQEAVNDSTLPVLSSVIVRKNYVKTTTDGQYVDLSALFAAIPYDKMKVVATLLYSQSVIARVFDTSYGYAFITSSTSNRASAHIGNATANLVTIANPSADYSAGFDGVQKEAFVDGTTNTGTSVTSSTPYLAFLFSATDNTASVAGVVKLKKMEVYNNGTLVAELVAATCDGVPCVYDTIGERVYYANSGDLAVE